MQRFKQWLYTNPGSFLLEEVEKSEPKEGMVRLEVKAFSICGSDLMAYHGPHARMVPPLVLGHEFCGVVDAIGKGVMSVYEGQRVAVNPVLNCGECWFCQNGRPNVCPNRHNTGTTVFAGRFDGGMREYTYMPESALMPLPDDIDFIRGVMIEPVGVCVHLANVGYRENEKNTVIFGCGPVGLITLIILKLMEVQNIICVDIKENRLALARKLGAALTVNPLKTDPVKAVHEYTPERGGADRVLLCTEAPETFLQGLQMSRIDGMVVMTGHYREEMTFNPEIILWNGLTIMTQLTFLREHLDNSKDLIRTQQIDVDQIITRVMPFAKLPEAFAILDNPDNQEIKIVIDVNA